MSLYFSEHLTFLGSEKYPNENGFLKFLQNSGGSSNADTHFEKTKFYFCVHEQFLNEGLDRFSNLFKAPLLQKESMMREREAIDSEYSAQKNDGDSRRQQVLASLSQQTHPFRKFNCGNLKTLKENIHDDILYDKIHDFKTRHYSAHRMYVCVQSKQSLDSLQEMIVHHFSDMPNNHLPGDDFSAFNHQNSFEPKFYEKVYFIKPIPNTFRIDLSWCMEPSASVTLALSVDLMSFYDSFFPIEFQVQIICIH